MAGKVEAGVQLLQRVLDTRDPFEVAVAHESLGEQHLEHGRYDEAVEALRRAIAAREGGGGTGHTELTLADALLRRPGPGDIDEAGRILLSDDVLSDNYLVFTASYYQHALLTARWCRRTGSAQTGHWARTALAYAARSEPDFPRHPTVGRPTPARDELKELNEYLHAV